MSLDLTGLEPEALRELCAALPKTELHCHLDGSLRVATVSELLSRPDQVELARSLGYQVPEDTSSAALEAQLSPGLECASLVEYLTAFDITCAVLQTPETLERAAYELALDAAAENVWYLETRFAPQRHIHDAFRGLEVLAAVDRGLARAEAEVGITTRIVVCAMRNYAPQISAYHRKVRELFPHSSDRELASHCSLEVARLAVAAQRQGLSRVIGFDLAGAEANFPPHHHTHAFHEITNALMAITVHAGEAYGPESIRKAVTYLGAHRIGHGTRLLEDPDRRLLQHLRDRRVGIEVCLTSNLQTKAVQDLGDHPLRTLLDQELRVSLCTDNRLVSGVTLTDEYERAIRAFDLDGGDLRRLVLYGFKSAFVSYAQRRELLLRAKERLRELGVA